MKAMRIVLKVIVWIVLAVVAVFLTLPLWLGPVGTTVANTVVPGIVKTDFHLGHLSLNPYTARFELGDMQLFNPDGYSEKYAATIGDIAFDVKTFSLLTDVIHIEEIKVKDIFVSYLSGGPEKINNFKQIQYNVAGGKEQYEAARSEKATEVAPAQDGATAPTQKSAEPRKPSEPEKPAKKFIIDRIEISGLLVQLGFVPIRIPVAFVMTDIGRDRGGMTASEIGQEIWNAILKRAGVVADQLQAFGIDTANRTSQRAGELTGQMSAQATDAVNESVQKVSDGAKKALESLKGLW